MANILIDTRKRRLGDLFSSPRLRRALSEPATLIGIILVIWLLADCVKALF